jgi:HEAT repeat protein
MNPERTDVAQSLRELFDAERSVRRIHGELAAASPTELVDALGVAVGEALGLDDEDEAALRLVRLAGLLGELEGPKAVDLLIDVLGSEEPESRQSAGEALEELAFDRFKEVALGVERALTRLPAGSPALLELPFILAEVGEPGVRKLLARFLQHADPEAVSAGIEAIVDMGDVGASALIEPLANDTRTVSLEDEEGQEGTVTLGELAREALKLLAELEDPSAVRGERPRSGGSNPGARGGRH